MNVRLVFFVAIGTMSSEGDVGVKGVSGERVAMPSRDGRVGVTCVSVELETTSQMTGFPLPFVAGGVRSLQGESSGGIFVDGAENRSISARGRAGDEFAVEGRVAWMRSRKELFFVFEVGLSCKEDGVGCSGVWSVDVLITGEMYELEEIHGVESLN